MPIYSPGKYEFLTLTNPLAPALNDEMNTAGEDGYMLHTYIVEVGSFTAIMWRSYYPDPTP